MRGLSRMRVLSHPASCPLCEIQISDVIKEHPAFAPALGLERAAGHEDVPALEGCPHRLLQGGAATRT